MGRGREGAVSREGGAQQWLLQLDVIPGRRLGYGGRHCWKIACGEPRNGWRDFCSSSFPRETPAAAWLPLNAAGGRVVLGINSVYPMPQGNSWQSWANLHESISTSNSSMTGTSPCWPRMVDQIQEEAQDLECTTEPSHPSPNPPSHASTTVSFGPSPLCSPPPFPTNSFLASSLSWAFSTCSCSPTLCTGVVTFATAIKQLTPAEYMFLQCQSPLGLGSKQFQFDWH